MTESITEITNALRCCADSKCGECNRLNNGISEYCVCSNDLHKVAADTIDRLTAENAALTERLKAAVDDWKTAVENANSMFACEVCKNRGYHAEDGLYCKVKSCHPVWRGEGSE